MSITIRHLDSTATDFRTTLAALLAFEASADHAIEQAVSDILADVKARGDAAVLDGVVHGFQLHRDNAISGQKLVYSLDK